MNTKLHINISQGVIDVEGDPDLAREIYADVKDHLLNGAKAAPSLVPAPKSEPVNDLTGKQKSKRRVAPKKKANGDEGSSGVLADSPKLDKNLDTSGLTVFYGQFGPKNNAEKILIFLKFITENLGIESPTTDQVYTCFKAVGEKIPKAFAQAFYDTSSKNGYIEFKSSTDIRITIAGDNHFTHSLKKKTAE